MFFVGQGYTPLVFTRVYTCNEVPDILQITDTKKHLITLFPGWCGISDFVVNTNHTESEDPTAYGSLSMPLRQLFKDFNNHSPLTRRAIIWGLVSWVPKLGSHP